MVELTHQQHVLACGSRDLAYLRTSIRATVHALSRWRPERDGVPRSIAALALTLLEFSRQLLEQQALRRMEAVSMSDSEAESMGLALARLEKVERDLTEHFALSPAELDPHFDRRSGLMSIAPRAEMPDGERDGATDHGPR